MVGVAVPISRFCTVGDKNAKNCSLHNNIHTSIIWEGSRNRAAKHAYALSMKARPKGYKIPRELYKSINMVEETTSSDLKVVKLTLEDILGAYTENKSEVFAEMHTTGFSWILDEKANEVINNNFQG